MFEEMKFVILMVKKDVFRIDRIYKFYFGFDDSKNLILLFNIFVIYVLIYF